MTPRALVAVLACAVLAPAHADPRLVLTHEPPPRTLRMRPRVVAQTTAPATASTSTPSAPGAPPALTPPAVPLPSARRADDDEVAALRDVSRRVSFSIDVGYQVDRASPTGKAALGSRAPQEGRDFEAVRAYGFGEAFGSTRGLGLASLSTYFAARFQAARRLQYALTPTRDIDVAPPIATWFERSGLELRYGWAEMKDFLPKAWGLSRLRARAGSQHIYGPWVMHVDGFLVAYEGPLLTASAYGGYRHADYTREQPDRRPSVNGASLRVDLRGLPTPLPIAVQSEFLSVGESAANMQPASTSSLVRADWRPGRDIAVIGQARFLNGDAASQRLEVRARYRQVTNLVLDVTHRTADDWRWDPALTAPDPDPLMAKRYLDMGPVVPQLLSSIRAGTLIAENVDLVVRGALSTDIKQTTTPATSFAAPYAELGGALEVRARRAIALGASLLTRNTRHTPLMMPIEDRRNSLEPLPPVDARGEEGFTELGATLKMTLGARRFSSMIEIYGRRTRYTKLYTDPLLEVPPDDVRLGGRVTIDAWAGSNLRLFAAYDVSSALDVAPELTGYRSLRLMMSGVY